MLTLAWLQVDQTTPTRGTGWKARLFGLDGSASSFPPACFALGWQGLVKSRSMGLAGPRCPYQQYITAQPMQHASSAAGRK